MQSPGILFTQLNYCQTSPLWKVGFIKDQVTEHNFCPYLFVYAQYGQSSQAPWQMQEPREAKAGVAKKGNTSTP
jgi:hypothetical protein